MIRSALRLFTGFSGWAQKSKVARITATVFDWADKATADDKISLREAFDLIQRIADDLGVELEYDLTVGDFLHRRVDSR